MKIQQTVNAVVMTTADAASVGCNFSSYRGFCEVTQQTKSYHIDITRQQGQRSKSIIHKKKSLSLRRRFHSGIRFQIELVILLSETSLVLKYPMEEKTCDGRWSTQLHLRQMNGKLADVQESSCCRLLFC